MKGDSYDHIYSFNISNENKSGFQIKLVKDQTRCNGVWNIEDNIDEHCWRARWLGKYGLVLVHPFGEKECVPLEAVTEIANFKEKLEQ